ncbi:MAG TPA: SDR family oxidoreductase [Solirubrobacteraceae bacterium]|nr:SDR family oxidoreductase [Solirubrobacteraceae bacterium]
MSLGLKERTVLVTGASEGIGKAAAIRFAQEGANLVICARREGPLRDLASAIENMGVAAVAVPCDVTDPAAPQTVLDAAHERFPGVDVLVNNAGRATPRKFLAATDEDWSEGMELNFMSAVRFTRACLPWMVENRWGRIVNVSSTTAKLADPYYAIYGAAKAAMINLSKTVASAFATDGIRCNCILPGVTATPLIEENIRTAAEKTGATPEHVMERMMERWPIPVGRLGKPEEVADAIAFLASATNDWITGVALPVDGGTIRVAG